MNAKPADRETVTFDYGIPAELFMGKRKGGARQPLRYRRFATAAEAIRFAIEELPAGEIDCAAGSRHFHHMAMRFCQTPSRYMVTPISGVLPNWQIEESRYRWR